MKCGVHCAESSCSSAGGKPAAQLQAGQKVWTDPKADTSAREDALSATHQLGDATTHLLEGPGLKTRQQRALARTEQQELSSITGRNMNGAAALEDGWRLPQRTKQNPAAVRLGIYPEELKT